jgi:hypothetical protein|tara:strand:- start:131 stop:292 length:162 start_codon:yes stop_codon:yes gene_type:complete
MLNELTQEQFEKVLEMLILYNQMTPSTKNVYLTEKSIIEAYQFMSSKGNELFK